MTTVYGVIGCGMMGQEHIRNLALIPDTKIGAVYEPDAGMLAVTRELVPDAKVATSIADLVQTPELDCLLIASPNYMHVDQLREITALRTLPILVEKPLATDPADRATVAEMAANYGAPIWVAMEYRFMPPIAKFLELVEEATGGVKMLTLREHRFPFLHKVNNWNRFNSQSGGTMVEKCCHFFDLMRLITKADPVRIVGSGGQMANHKDERVDGVAPDIWDSGYSAIDFDNGARAMLEICMFAEGSDYQEEISAVGPKGKIECLVPGPARMWPAHRGPQPEAKVVISPRDKSAVTVIDVPVDETLATAGDHHGSTFHQHEQFVRVVRGEIDPQVTLRDGWMAVAMGMATQQSASDDVVVDFAGQYAWPND
ncbi:oxidoreductase [Actibacterium mucosum KCTC 23349]|uniref:Oxidoreductase n=1 Tax=Actibacterium mucosum KCTC 23349 TaxID=1454373 RepID=A0A037ZKC5_9RHOB|nr:Gfo/Idh/MocA family oxidoreductase [Actibacterium mucosum]KAJ55992.1 oxidoreductase [Actibacterium mucosum KCTC 23349]